MNVRVFVANFSLLKRYKVLKLYSLLLLHVRLLAFVLLLSGLGIILSVLPPLATRAIVDEGIGKGNVNALVFNSLLLLMLNIASTIIGALGGYYRALLSGRVALELRTGVFRKTLELGVELYEEAAVGDVATRIYGYVDRIQRFIVDSFENIIINSLRLAFMLIVIFALNAKLSLALLAPLPLYVWGLVWYQPRVRMLFTKRWSRVSRMSAYITSTLNSVLLVKLTGKEKDESKHFENLAGDVFRTEIETAKYNLLVFPWLNLLLTLASVGVMYLGGLMVLHGELSIGTLMAFLAYIWQVYAPVQALTGIIPQLAEAEAAYEKLSELLEATPRVTEAPDSVELEAEGRVDVVNLWFGYSAERPILRGVNLSVEPGDVVGIVGPNGAGKTTLVRMLARLYDPAKGTIMLDGVDMRKIKLSCLRRNVLLVPQEPMLLTGSVAYNISYGVENPDPLSVLYAAWLCGAHRFIVELPLAYDSDVGEQGRALSGGQRQLICLARALLLKPKVLLLDEATSNVHVELEEVIMTRLLGYLRDTTIIAISHRPTLNKFVKRVVVMSDGRALNEIKGGLDGRPPMPPIPRIVEAGDVKVVDRGAWLEAHVKGRALDELRARLPFPLTYPRLLVLYRDPDDMLIVDDWTKLDPESKRAVLKHIAREHGLVPAKLREVVPLGGRGRALSLNVVLESEEGRVEVSISPSGLLLLNKNLLIATPTKVYVVDSEASNGRAVSSAYALAAEPPNPFGHDDFALLAKEIKEAFWSSRDAVETA